MTRRGPEVTADNVAAFEQAFGYSLPEDYRRFLLEVNGGRTDKAHRRFPRGILNTLLSLDDCEEEMRDLLTQASRVRTDLATPYLLVVGYDDGGARILIALDGEHRGEVWMHIPTDARPPDSNPRVLWHDRRDFRKLADSFEAFVGSLKPLS